MRIIESTIEGVPLIVVEGDLDHASKQVVLDAVGDIFQGAYPPKSVLIDLTDCTFVDSGGLGVLLTTIGRLPDDGWLGIIGASGGPNRVLQYTGFLEHQKVRFFSTLSDAMWTLARAEMTDKSGSRKHAGGGGKEKKPRNTAR